MVVNSTGSVSRAILDRIDRIDRTGAQGARDAALILVGFASGAAPLRAGRAHPRRHRDQARRPADHDRGAPIQTRTAGAWSLWHGTHSSAGSLLSKTGPSPAWYNFLC
jgi:hypothetical protein